MDKKLLGKCGFYCVLLILLVIAKDALENTKKVTVFRLIVLQKRVWISVDNAVASLVMKLSIDLILLFWIKNGFCGNAVPTRTDKFQFFGLFLSD